MRLSVIILSLVVAICNSNLVFAHAEKDKARYVSPKGTDSGSCDNIFRPCKTISYAAGQANKGDKVLVAKGSYDADIFALVNPLVPVYGGYSQVDHYQTQNPNLHHTYVRGVPPQYAEKLSNKGFQVIVDAKAALKKSIQTRLAQIKTTQQKQQAQTCESGTTGVYPCNKIDLVGHLPLGEFDGNQAEANDIWGHTDLNTGKEYAIIGLQKGTAVVDVSNPQDPKIVGQVDGRASIWRDIKVYQFYDSSNQHWKAYAYVTTDDVGDEGLAIIDLTNLAQNTIELVQKQDVIGSAHNVYISGVDYMLNIASEGQTPLLHISGADGNGVIRTYSLDNPESLNAEHVNSLFNRSNYSHDASSLLIDDERVSDCKNANQLGCLVLLDFNEDEVRLYDNTDPTELHRIASRTYANAEYVHSGWWSEDKQYVFIHDELDEQRNGINTTLRVMDISNLEQPAIVHTWEGPTRAIDHNGFVLGNRYYMSNYQRGLTVLDISNPTAIEEVGYFDTYPSGDAPIFSGAWGTYPYLPSGLILVSDIDTGLYILRDNTRENLNLVSFSAAEYQGKEGDTVTISVARSGDTSGALDVSYQALPGSAQASDFALAEGTLSWQAGETDVKEIQVQITPDSQDQEFEEKLFVRLHNPKNDQAQLGQHKVATVVIEGIKNNGVLAFGQSDVYVKENQQSMSVTVNRNASANEAVSVNYELIDTSTDRGDIEAVSGTLDWAAGDSEPKTINIALFDDQLQESEELAVLRLFEVNNATIGEQNQITIHILDDESNQAPVVNAGDDRNVSASSTVNLTGTVTDDSTEALTYSWEQTGGATVNLTGRTEVNSQFVAPNAAATLAFVLTATDSFGASSSDEIVISVQAPPPQPQVDTSVSGGVIQYLLMLLIAVGIQRRRK